MALWTGPLLALFVGSIAFPTFACKLFDHFLLVSGEVSCQVVKSTSVWDVLAQGSIRV